jgi:predicted nucleic acid-binding protein
MTTAFVDTQYFIAIFQESDQWHIAAENLEGRISNYDFVTTESVLCEVLNYFCGFGKEVRREVAALVTDIFSDSSFRVIGQSSEMFFEGLGLYKSRLDKGYNLTNCISMNVCRDMEITEILTHDNHFTQEGFKNLL